MGCEVKSLFLACIAGACMHSCNGGTDEGASVFLEKLEQPSAVR